MERYTENRPEYCARLSREKAFWDRVYGEEGLAGRHYSWMEYVDTNTYISQFFGELLGPERGRRILSIGGGIDRFGLSLAGAGHRVVCVDISSTAAARTSELAEHAGVADRLTAVADSCEEVDLPTAGFDAVVCKRALHHMDVPRILARMHDALTPDGIFLAEEPICLHGLLRWVHGHFPFYGDAPRTPDERELDAADLEIIRRTFSKSEIYYFDLISRESIAFMLSKAGMDRLLNLLGRLDFWFLNEAFPPLRALSNYVVIRAHKSR